ncbi:Uncharacterized protein PKNOH_S130189400 [Plasmodium knowlesi]|uniref:Mitochondrial ribosomal protein L46 n=1 Tax=Plasmodium knowlesi TaxID=5850 RepID=A0A1Y3DJQ9_PLAKN|nr:Uncharacterized protein PKNOH_S130189400 [Plasmodium knowlesi]
MIRKIAERGIMKKNAHRSYFHLGKYNGGLFLSDKKYVHSEGGLKAGSNHLGNDPAEGGNTVDSCIGNSVSGSDHGSIPPGVENKIFVHQKYKVQMALCIDRFPLTFEQEEFEKDFEDFKDKWLQKTNNNLNINEEFLHMKYNLSSFHDRKKENYLESTNLEDEMGHEKGKKDKGVDHILGEEAMSAENDDLENLFAIEEHLKCEMPFFIGYSPCTFEKRKYKIPLSFNEIIGRKIFYYRAHYLNHNVNLDLSNNDHINDFAWLSRSELKDYLSSNKYQIIKDAIPLT